MPPRPATRTSVTRLIAALALATASAGATCSTSVPGPAGSATPPALSIRLDLAPAIGGFTRPLDLQQPNDGSRRVFVVEQAGTIKVVDPAAGVQATPFIDVAKRPGFTWGGETGLLGLAFHPNYAANGRFFVNYTRYVGSQLQTVIAEFAASPPGSDTANLDSERILLTIDQPFTNHNGGGLAFGPEGFLYIGLGDGGSGGDPLCNAQNLNSLLGKMLRIDVNGSPPAGQQYAIPSSNPFANQADRRGEIWLYGLRNPFRFSFDAATGDLYIGDVGQGAYEEVDTVTAADGGANLGWNLFEGSHPYSTACGQPSGPLTTPIFDYSHASGDTVVTGGYVYRGSVIGGFAGTYVFGDFGSGRVWTLARNAQGQWVRSANAVLSVGANNLSAFGQTQNGELYVVRYSSGDIARIRQAAGLNAPARLTAPTLR